MKESLTREEQQMLLHMAREAMEQAVRGEKLPPLNSSTLSSTLREEGASFVTLTIGGRLRGCIGALEAYQPLSDDVREHAVAAALDDPRFPPVREGRTWTVSFCVMGSGVPRSCRRYGRRFPIHQSFLTTFATKWE